MVPWCASHAGGTQEDRPAPARRSAPRRVLFALAVLHCAGRVLLVRRPPEGLLGGMWAFPEAEVADAAASESAARAMLLTTHRALCDAPERLSTREHRFTHLHATYYPYLFHVEVEGSLAFDADELAWVDLATPGGVALPVAQRRILESAREHLVGSAV
ncbi:MAG: NUDIX domain-containing protein [Gemmatimonadota bacterium]|nr:NUDIX domain-containing protein [Gemmatimonadota bacterium]